MKKVKLHIQYLPLYTPAGHPIFVSGNFNGWQTGEHACRFSQNGDGSYELTFETHLDEITFRIHRGNWDLAEGDVRGNPNPVRYAAIDAEENTIPVIIDSWVDFYREINLHTVSENVLVVDHSFDIPQLNRQRRVIACLPKDYWTSGKHYPVLYMQDAQNLFDSFNTLGGEWDVDGIMESLYGGAIQDLIIIGIDHGNEKRLDEYAPWKNENEGGGEGKLYAAFLVHTLKPYIDKHFRTLSGREHTGIMGSSMGGLISLYAALEYPGIFGRAGVFSPSLWFTNDIFDFAREKTKKHDTRWMLTAGKKESDRMASDLLQLYFLLKDAGYRDDELHLDLHADGTHSEKFWSREFLHAVRWMFRDESFIPDMHCIQPPLRISYNEIQHLLEIRTDSRIASPVIELWQGNGKRITQRNLFYCKNYFQLPLETDEVIVELRQNNIPLFSRCISTQEDILLSA